MPCNRKGSSHYGRDAMPSLKGVRAAAEIGKSM